MDRLKRRALRIGQDGADPRRIAAHDSLCEAGDLLEELYIERRDERIRDAIRAIDMVRIHLRSQS